MRRNSGYRRESEMNRASTTAGSLGICTNLQELTCASVITAPFALAPSPPSPHTSSHLQLFPQTESAHLIIAHHPFTAAHHSPWPSAPIRRRPPSVNQPDRLLNKFHLAPEDTRLVIGKQPRGRLRSRSLGHSMRASSAEWSVTEEGHGCCRGELRCPAGLS